MIVSTAPNGYFVDDLIVSGPLYEGGFASCGFQCDFPDLLNSSISELNQVHERVARFLSALGPEMRMQVQWYCDADYRKELQRYAEETRTIPEGWTKRVREERFERYWTKIEARELRRERVHARVPVPGSGIARYGPQAFL